MEVISMVVNDEFGVMQRVMGVFTRKRINVDTIVVGRCEIAGKSRIVLTVKDMEMANVAVADLKRCMISSSGSGGRHGMRHTRSGELPRQGSLGRNLAEVDKIIEASSRRYLSGR
jgi:acetolactate synthase-1/3 small subunit